MPTPTEKALRAVMEPSPPEWFMNRVRSAIAADEMVNPGDALYFLTKWDSARAALKAAEEAPDVVADLAGIVRMIVDLALADDAAQLVVHIKPRMLDAMRAALAAFEEK